MDGGRAMGGNGWATGDFYFPQFIFKLVLNLRTNLAIPRRGFDGHNGEEGATGIQGGQARKAAQHPAMHRAAPPRHGIPQPTRPRH